MTHQSADFITFEGEQYEALGGDFSKQMFNSYGIKPVMMSTGCDRGYQVRYSIEDKIVYLQYLHVHDSGKNYPTIGNVMPTLDRWQFAIYDNLHVKLPIDGSMIIGRDLAARSPSMRLAHHYRIVYQLEFEQGKLSSLTDLSVKVALLRQQMDELKTDRENIAPELRENHRKEELGKLYGQIFSLTYGMKIPDDVKE